MSGASLDAAQAGVSSGVGLLRRYGVWIAAAALILVLPQVFSSGTSITKMSVMGVMIVFALSYNMLLGQTGMLSFGHAVYYGLGGFLVVHALNTVGAARLPVPVVVQPLVGGLAGLTFGIIFGAVSTRRAGTAFAMISLGIGELVASLSLILRAFFGGEEGIAANRAKGLRLFELSFGPQIQVYYLIAVWCFLCVAAMYAITRTPLGRMCNAVRDNPERAEFIGYSTQTVRFLSFALCSLGFGLTGVSFAVGIAFTSVWYPKRNQGTALGIFGAGNAGAALTTLLAPTLLNWFTANGTHLEGWRKLPLVYAALLLVMGVVFLIFSTNKKPTSSSKTLVQLLEPLRSVRVWRFGLYYFLVFGCFVAFSQWLVPYFVNVYYLPLVTAGVLAALFSFPSGVIRAAGGWMSDRWGARRVMFWVLASSCAISFAVTIPKMEILSPGKGIMATASGTVTAISAGHISVGAKTYSLVPKPPTFANLDATLLVLPTKEVWQEPAVVVGQTVQRRELLAKGVTRIFFQANVWIFAALVLVLGSIWGVGKAAVYKYIPDYFPEEVGVVGGMVGVLGGLGGFFCPIAFGYLLEGTGLWTSCWMFMFALSVACLFWMLRTVRLLDTSAASISVGRLESHSEKVNA